MAEIAKQVQATVPADPRSPVVESSSVQALGTVSPHKTFDSLINLTDRIQCQVRLAETFLDLAESLKKPRASLLRN